MVHGLWMRGIVMKPLAWRLARAGYRCHLFDYAGHARPFATHVERLRRFAHERAPRGAHFVGHSMGGLVVIGALNGYADTAVGRVVLLGSPVRGCAAGRRLEEFGWGRWMLGESREVWRAGNLSCWTRAEPLGVVAGTVPFGLGRALGRLQGPNDGVVRVDETAVAGMRERIELPVAHSAMLFSGRVAANVCAFLESAGFLHDAA